MLYSIKCIEQNKIYKTENSIFLVKLGKIHI